MVSNPKHCTRQLDGDNSVAEAIAGDDLVKVKRFDDAWFVILSVDEEMLHFFALVGG